MSNLGGRRVLDLDWVESWARRVNEDRVLPVIGRFFSVRFVLGICLLYTSPSPRDEL